MASQRFIDVVLGMLLLAPMACSAAIELDELENGVCPEGFKACDGRCVNTDSPSFGCGGASCTPCALGHALSNCNPQGECAISSCVGDYFDCDGVLSNGCEVDLAHDPQNCQVCGHICENPENAFPACGDSRCSLSHCMEGFGDCDRDFANGCETPLGTDEHCGRCGDACSAEQSCVDGGCSP